MVDRHIQDLPAIDALALDDPFAVVNLSSGINLTTKATPQKNIDLLNAVNLLEAGSLKDGAVSGALSVETIPDVPVAIDDKVLIKETSDSDILKTVTAQSIANLAPGAAPFTGAMLRLTAPVNIADITPTIIDWTEVTDIGGFFNPANPKRLTVPAGVSYVRLNAGSRWVSDTGGYRTLSISMNTEGTVESNVTGLGMVSQNAVSIVGAETELNLSSGIIAVIPGDYFVVRVFQQSAGALDLNDFDSGTYFTIENAS